MKLKNIIIALSVLAAFSACSKDDDPQGPEKYNASLSIRVANKTLTKADDPHELEGEANINNLAAFVFNAVTLEGVGGKMEALTGVSHEHEMTGIPAETGSDPALIVLVANAPVAAMQAVSNYADLQEALAQLSDQQQSNLTMSTQVITTELPLDYGDNYIGFGSEQTNVNDITEPLWLTRLPARLDVTGVRTNFTRPELLGRTVTVRTIRYANVKTESHYFSVLDWGIVQADSETADTTPIQLTDVVIDNDNPATLDYHTYVMENYIGPDDQPENPTAILVLATLSATDEYRAESVWFRANINTRGGGGTIDGIDVNHRFVKRNFVYGIAMTFGDDAFDGLIPPPEEPPIDPEPDPDPTLLSIEVTVVGWGEVSLDVPID